MARTDAIAVEGLDSALKRAQAYLDAGADMIFAEACKDVYQLSKFKNLRDSKGTPAKILCNITEFGVSPMFKLEELSKIGVDMALYPLSAQRAMAKAALTVYKEIIEKGTQEGVLDIMQTRKELYDVLGYEAYEKTLDELFKRQQAGENNSGKK